MTPPIKTILCPVDFTACSENALRYALQLADKYQAKIQLLHVIMPATEAVLEVPGAMPMANRRLEEDTRTALIQLTDKVLTQIGEKLQHAPVLNSQVEVGTPGFLMQEVAADQEAQLIVMGTKRQEKRPWYLGSVASDALQKTACPLLIVPDGASFEPFERVSLATDLRLADIGHLLELNHLLQPFHPDIRCIHVKDGSTKTGNLPFDYLATLCEQQLPQVNVTFHELEEDDTTEALEAFNLVYHVDLQVMTRPHRSFFSELFHRSQVRRTVKYTHVPVLVLAG